MKLGLRFGVVRGTFGRLSDSRERSTLHLQLQRDASTKTQIFFRSILGINIRLVIATKLALNSNAAVKN
ncbi:hypothetical protein ACHAXS_005822 [Conticribra weissflogii]